MDIQSIQDIRAQIDAIDDELVRLFVERMRCSTQIAGAKQAADRPTYDPDREKLILQRLADRAGDTYAPYVKALYGHIFDLSRRRQSTLRWRESPLTEQILRTTALPLPDRAVIACQGTAGAYGQQATQRLFAHPDIRFFDSFEEVFSAVENDLCQYGVLPIENSTAGAVNQVYDLMQQHHFYIAAAQRLRIDHKLMRRRGTAGPITEIVSHEQALRQCSAFLNAHPDVRVTPMANTAVAAEFTASSPRDDLAVIASEACARLYGLDIIRDDISDSANNYTRFICISRSLRIAPGAEKISLMVDLPHEPGALNTVLSRITEAGVNLTKLESRPIPERVFEFRFFFDMEARADDPDIRRLLSEIEGLCTRFAFLGCYEEQTA